MLVRDPQQSFIVFNRRAVTLWPIYDQNVHVFEKVKIDFQPRFFRRRCFFADIRFTVEVSVVFVLFIQKLALICCSCEFTNAYTVNLERSGKMHFFGLLNQELHFFSILGKLSFSSVWDERKIYEPRCVTFPIEQITFVCLFIKSEYSGTFNPKSKISQ